MSTKLNFRIVARGLRFPEGPLALADGSVLLVEVARGTLSRVRPDGAVEVVAELGGGPNGAALGPDGAVYVCNNGGFRWREDRHGLRPLGQADDYRGGRIERVDLARGEARVLYEAGPNGPLRGPNDIVFDRAGGMWFTDMGKARARELDRGGVYYARIDGGSISEAVYPLLTPNGIGLAPDETRLYVAETLTGRLWAFDLEAPGVVKRRRYPSPNGAELVAGLPGFQLFDSLALEAGGNICVATLFNGGITVISPDGRGIEHLPLPDDYTTNLCFGGPDLRTAYVTLSASGQLVALDWPRPGLALNFGR
ncbi:MAG TPA: SMP-30/gluconolactonase/LRE family protein [Burkholderiales bacterium]|nr:SMP-30/gluconolactonase/LRE family protein [Burkholderiales bacterium]